MKICNNCSTINQDAAVKCTQCNMPNNFTYQGADVHVPHEVKDTIHCLNCGSQEPGKGDKCLHCRFPLPKQPGSGIQHQASIIEYPASSNQKHS